MSANGRPAQPSPIQRPIQSLSLCSHSTKPSPVELGSSQLERGANKWVKLRWVRLRTTTRCVLELFLFFYYFCIQLGKYGYSKACSDDNPTRWADSRFPKWKQTLCLSLLLLLFSCLVVWQAQRSRIICPTLTTPRIPLSLPCPCCWGCPRHVLSSLSVVAVDK